MSTNHRRQYVAATATAATAATAVIAIGLLACALPSQAQGDNWPSKPIHFVTPYPPGGSADTISRFVADRVSRTLGATVLVENKPGAGAALGTDYAAHQPPDGYSFFVGPTATVAVAPYIKKVNFSYESFEPVAKLASSYGLISARKDAPFSNYTEFVASAKANPGKYTYATNGVGSIVHLTATLLQKQAGIRLVHVPYKGAVDSMNDMMGGRIDVMYDPVTAPRVKAGDLKGLATTSNERNPQLPDIATLKEQGFDVDMPSWFGLFAPKGTPAPIVNRMADAVRQALQGPGVREQLLLSAMYPDYEGPPAFGERVRRDSAFLRDLIQKEGIKAD